ncbi:MAG: hypothetical protein WD314_02265 [Trueperaceae bacterium]
MDGVPVDLMPPDETILGFSNRWYYSIIEHAVPMALPGGTTIRLASGPFLIASKLEAFHGRGEGHYRYSHDIEDIIVVLDGRMEIVDEIRQAPSDVRSYLAAEFGKLLGDEDFVEGIGDHLLPDAASQQRTDIIRERMRRISESDR